MLLGTTDKSIYQMIHQSVSTRIWFAYIAKARNKKGGSRPNKRSRNKSAALLRTHLANPHPRSNHDKQQQLSHTPAQQRVHRAPAPLERLYLKHKRADCRQAPAIAVRQALQYAARRGRDRTTTARVVEIAEDEEDAGEERGEGVGGECAEGHTTRERVQADGEEVAREGAREGEEQGSRGLCTVCFGQEEVCKERRPVR